MRRRRIILRGQDSRDDLSAGIFETIAWATAHSANQMEPPQMAFTQWIKQAVGTLVDPDRNSRVDDLTAAMQRTLFEGKGTVPLERALASVDYRPSDLDLAKERIYFAAIKKGWDDGRLTVDERNAAQTIAKWLRMEPNQVRRINVEFAKRHFALSLARAMDDGKLDPHEELELAEIASAVGSTVSDFIRAFFLAEGEAFLRGIFLTCVADNHLSQEEWSFLLRTTQKLGLSQDELLLIIQPQARQFVEHVLVDAKSDGRLSTDEQKTLAWLLGNLRLPRDFCHYVQSEVELLRTLTSIDDGRLPVEPPPPGVAIRSGEIVHFHGGSTWLYTRILKSGPRTDHHVGTMTLTDNRLLFSSSTKSQAVAYRRIVTYGGGAGRIEIQADGKPSTTFFLHNSTPVPFAIFRGAIAMSNQTLVAKVEGLPSRHIPRDVRQRVWQRYGGRCADCAADDYLEFDHIIPVAKGGSNSDGNVQLLCRRCNLKKSDFI